MIYEDLKSHLDSLTTSEKSELFEYLKFTITFGTEHQTEYKLLNFDHSTTTCPRCHSNHINKMVTLEESSAMFVVNVVHHLMILQTHFYIIIKYLLKNGYSTVDYLSKVNLFLL